MGLMAGHFALAERGIQVDQLKTGQKFIVEEDHSLPIIRIYTVLRSGSIWDPKQYEGLTAFMGEMMLRGTKNRSRSQITDELDQLGADISVDVGSESISVTGYTLTRNLDQFLEIYGDVILNPSFDAKELEKLKRETLSDLKQMRENDQELVGRFFKRELFQKHPYGMSTDGMESTVSRIYRDKVVEIYQRFFVRDNIFFSAVGDLNAKALGEKLASMFSTLPQRKTAAFQYPKFDPIKGRTLLLVNKPERTQTQIMIGHYGIEVTHPDYFPLMIANNAFGGSFTSRLMHEVRVKRGWSYGAYSWFRPRLKPGEFSMWVMPASKDTLPTLKLMLELYEAYAKEGITQEEFDRSKKNLVNEYAFKIDTAAKRVGQYISIELMGLPKDYLETYQANLKKVTLEEANQVIQKISNPKDLVMTMVCTASEFKKQLPSVLGKDIQVIVKSYKDE